MADARKTLKNLKPRKQNSPARRSKGLRKNKTKSTINTITAILTIIAVIIFFVSLAGPNSGCKGGKETTQRTTQQTIEKSSERRTEKRKTQNKTIADLEIPAPINNKSEQIIHHKGYTVSYNEDLRLPNWVAYQLIPSEVMGEEERSDKFLPDPMVDGLCATTGDYTNSGFDRGHMAPAADMKWDATAMRESFYMTNICPQLHKLNAGVWKDYEERGRRWASHDTIYIVCGPIVSSNHKTIGENRVAVPSSFFKAFLRCKNNTYSAIGIICPNVAERTKMRDYIVTIDYIEEVTGMDLFPALPDNIETEIESQTPMSAWGIK